MRRILVLGNSHTQSIRDAAEDLDDVEVYWLKTKDRKDALEIPDAERMIAALGPDDCLVLTWLGTLHNVIGLLNHDRPFAVIDGISGAGAQDRPELIPTAAMRSYIDSHARTAKLLPRLAALARCRVGHVMPPPPKKDLGALAASSKAYRGQAISDYGFSPAPRRLALWRLEAQVVGDYLRGLGIVPLTPPPSVLTEEGYLHPDCSAADATHANAAYGAKIIDHLRGFAAKPDLQQT